MECFAVSSGSDESTFIWSVANLTVHHNVKVGTLRCWSCYSNVVAAKGKRASCERVLSCWAVSCVVASVASRYSCVFSGVIGKSSEMSHAGEGEERRDEGKKKEKEQVK